MFRFRTELNIKKSSFELNHRDKIVLIGSCFTENIGNCLLNSKFSILQNPFGTLYNPISISNLIGQSLKSRPGNQVEFDQINKIYFDYNYHSQLSALSRAVHIDQVDAAHIECNEWMHEAKCLILSLGSSYAHYLKSSGRIVANCHKQKAGLFGKKLLSEQEVISAFEELICSVRSVNPTLKIIITISPVRHIAEGLIGNNLSKARLLTATHEFIEKHEDVSYFPSYELVLDDLRDYRYYTQDLIHPNEQAIEYIWLKFSETYFSPKTIDLISRIDSILKAIAHRANFQESSGHLTFLQQTKDKIMQMQKEFSFLDFSKELESIEAKLK